MSSLTLKALIGGMQALDLNDPTATYALIPGSLDGFGEPEIEAAYSDSRDRQGSTLTHRRFRNRVLKFSLAIFASSGTDGREVARNAVAAVIDKARRYATRSPETVGTTATANEVVIKMRPPDGTAAVYARLIDGGVGSPVNPYDLGSETADGRAIEWELPVVFILAPFWTTERPVRVQNLLLNGGFEAGYAGGTPTTPYGWSYSTTGSVTPASAEAGIYTADGAKSWRVAITASTGAGTTNVYQDFAINTLGLAVGHTIRAMASVYVRAVAGTARAVIYIDILNGAGATIQSANATTTTTGQRVSLQAVADLPTGAATIRVYLRAEALASGDTIDAYFDNALFDDHNLGPQMLLNGSFEADADADGVSDSWTSTSAGSAATVTRPATAKYGLRGQSAALGSGTTAHTFSQVATLANFNVKAGDTLTLAAWAHVTRTGAASAWLRLWLTDGTNVLSETLSTPTTVAAYTALSVSAAVPPGATQATAWLYTDNAGGATITTIWDWAVLYAGHHDPAGGRFWPSSEWIESGRLTSDPTATDGRQIVAAHDGFRGNVPAPCQILIGCYGEIPDPLVVGYKRGDNAFAPWAGAEATASVGSGVAAETADADAIGGNSRVWTPGGTTEQFLALWAGTDTPPGRYLVLVRAKLSDQTQYARYAFRAAARLLDTATTAGSWDLVLHPAPPWINTSGTPGYEVWSAGVIPFPLIDRLPAYVNASRFEIWGIASATGGTVRLDGVWFVPLDGYACVQPSYYARQNAPAANTTANRYTVLLDTITPLPGGLVSNTNGATALALPSSFSDRPDTEEDPIFLGQSGKLIVIQSGATHVKTDLPQMAVLYQPCWTTAGVVSG